MKRDDVCQLMDRFDLAGLQVVIRFIDDNFESQWIPETPKIISDAQIGEYVQHKTMLYEEFEHKYGRPAVPTEDHLSMVPDLVRQYQQSIEHS